MRVFVHLYAPVLTLLLLALLASALLWGPGMVNTRGGGDSPFLLQRLTGLLVNLRAGVFPARWMPDAAYGLGYPFFNYYAALPYYLAAGFNLLGLDVLAALKLTQTLGFVAAALACYGWTRRLFAHRAAAWLAAAAYTLAPFHLVNVYVRGDSLSEFYAFVFYPLVLWGLEWALERPSVTRSLAAALPFTALVLTHNVSALIFTPFALLYAMVLLAGSERGTAQTNTARDEESASIRARPRPILASRITALATLFVVGVLLSAWLWLPALGERNYGQLGTMTEGYFHYANHFRTANLVQWSLDFNYSVSPDLTGRSPFAMGGPQAGLALLGLGAWGLTRIQRARAGRPGASRDLRPAYVVFGLLLATAMITPLSRPLWDHLPLLPMVQFPWRFLSVQALFAALATGWLVDLARRRWARIGVVLAATLLLAASALLALRPERLPLGPDDVTVERLQVYELFSGNIGTSITFEYLPSTFVPRPYTSEALLRPGQVPPAIALDGAQVEATLLERGPVAQRWQVRSEQGGGLAFPLALWPGWTAQVDGQAVPVRPAPGSGLLALDVPPGEHTVRLQLTRTPLRAVADGVSLAAALGVGGWLLVALGRGRRRVAGCRLQVKRAFSSAACPLLLALGFLLPVAGLLLVSRSSYADDDLTMDFVQMPYLHHNPDGVDFGPARLVGYDLSADVLAPGDVLTVTLRWSDLREAGASVRLRLVSPAAVREDLGAWTEASAPLDERTVLTLALPSDLPRGLYLLQLGVEWDGTALPAFTPGGEQQGPLYLRPVRVPDGPALPADVPLLATFGPGVRLHAATFAPAGPGRLGVSLGWSTAYPLAANYGISLRLFDGDGNWLTALDTQPGYGFLPTSMWRPGEWVRDEYELTVPEGVEPSPDCYLEVVLYDVSTLQPAGRTTLRSFPWPLAAPVQIEPPLRSFDPPQPEHPLDAQLGDGVRLAGYDLDRQGDHLALTLWWVARRQMAEDYTVFVHLFDPDSRAIAAQDDAMPRRWTYPTSMWAAGEVVSDTIVLPLGAVAPGSYRLALGMVLGEARLPVMDAAGTLQPDGQIVLPAEVRWP